MIVGVDCGPRFVGMPGMRYLVGVVGIIVEVAFIVESQRQLRVSLA